MFFKNLIFVMLGGAFGAAIRYTANHFFDSDKFPYATLLVNITGCLLIGIFFFITEKSQYTFDLRLFLITGLLGALTTFSSYSFETFYLIRKAAYLKAGLNIFLNNSIGILMAFLGYRLSTLFFR
ncbi:MAG: fluoride efflux transporter CrcB [Candidatus Muiribacterium halophilum]|uniref:Fluoride-specific ion channel FluC n=1 Tax=Muiribacterium halophilum TaxID=2053465 RepID=A0A2N5ZFP4_MUIH1|nr:MAG: fluoride efflux transporter CrcB [Candidatus Muirbacterium halophilum]